jgi:N-methylhydantoinase A/oxoprolinase/acetone carboxylase beta subunit
MSGQNFVLGIDTGGTYTDGVLLDFKTREVIKTTKTLTTKPDLSEGILNALDALLPAQRERIKLVSISTTLATNAIAEGKGRPVALFLLGYDPELVRHFHFEGSFATPKYYYFKGGHTLTGEAQAPLDRPGIIRTARDISPEIEAFSISGYFSPFNISHEEAAAEEILRETGKPVVMGHQLSSKLNSIQRATTAALNASLLSILQEFISSIEGALSARGVQAPLMVVHSDGSLMKTSQVKAHPVETVHSGPAASAIGARFLAGVDKALVIDIGGTTTDIALLDRGRLKINDSGTTVGEFHTAVRAADVRSIGLGGDSFLRLDVENELKIGPERVVPLAYLASRYPAVLDQMKSLTTAIFAQRPTIDHFEYWFLLRKPTRLINNDRSMRVLAMLEDGPLPLPVILKRMEVMHPMQLDSGTLIREEIVGRAALTPSDLFHLSGEFSPWEVEAARMAAEKFALLMQIDVESLIHQVRERIAELIVEEVVRYITGQGVDRMPEYAPVRSLGAWLFEENLYRKNPYLRSELGLKMPIVGIGAPAGILLPRVAELLHTELLLPEHYEVANAVGAVAGKVIVHQDAWVYPKIRNRYPVGYILQSEQGRKIFSTGQEALEYASGWLGEAADQQARLAGAEAVELETEILPDGAESFRVRVTAIGELATKL